MYDAGQVVQTPPVWHGRESTVKLGRTEPIVVAVPSGQAGRIKTEVSRVDPLYAPITVGQAMAKLKVKLDDVTLLELPLLSLQNIEQAGFMGRTLDTIRLWIK